MKNLLISTLLLPLLAAWAHAQAPQARIVVQTDQVLHPVSRTLTGACLEDVNHEVYGGLYSQMIFGESFQEPPPSVAPAGFHSYGGQWTVSGDELRFAGAPGDKLASETAAFQDGEVGVEVFVADRAWSNVGLVVRLANASNGMDSFDGYEVALNPSKQCLILGRHRQNWELIQEVACEIPVGQWLPLRVKLEGRVIEAFFNGKSLVRHEDGDHALLSGTVGLRAFQSEGRYRNLWVKTGGEASALRFVKAGADQAQVSGLWRPVRQGGAEGRWTFDPSSPFVGVQSQALSFAGGDGVVGVANQGLNRWGLCFVGGRGYEGLLWARAEKPAELWVALESADGTTVHAEKRLSVSSNGWQRLEFSLTPKATEAKGRFTVKLKRPGAVSLGYAFLQPGPWGRFRGLPARRDVAEALVNQGITVLRYGGSMINHQEYRWKKMIGPRDRRPPSAGTWYPHSSNGWGIPDFMAFCEAAGFEYVPAFNLGETPEDMADFVEYAKAAPETEWGRKRADDGHPKPYRLRYMELGNEERVDDQYAGRFEALAKAIWAKDPGMILVVGDFCYGEPIADPSNFRGAASGITNLDGQRRILQLAKQNQREVWFDVHVGTDGPRPDATFAGMFSFRDALDKIADGARHKVVVFEFNAGNPTHRRALANALAIQAIERDGQIPIATSANSLQPDGQNDNGWDQGLLFLNPSRVWLQPPGYVTRMFSRNYEPELVACTVTGAAASLDAAALRSQDGHVLVLQLVNTADQPVTAEFTLGGFTPRQAQAQVEELAGPLDAKNTADQPDVCVAHHTAWDHGLKDGKTVRTLPARSVSVLRFE